MGKFRYAICKRCREKWNIAIRQDTGRGYVCPYCDRRWKEYQRELWKQYERKVDANEKKKNRKIK